MYSRLFTEIKSDIAEKGRKNNRSSLELKMPINACRLASVYYMKWGYLFLLDNYKGLWKDALAISISYYPFNIFSWCYYITGLLPFFMRSPLFILHAILGKLHRVQLSMLASIPYLRKIRQSFTKRLFHT